MKQTRHITLQWKCGKPTPLGVGWIAKYFIINCV